MRNCLEVKGPSLDVYEVLPRGDKAVALIQSIHQLASCYEWLGFLRHKSRIATLTARSLLLSDNFRELPDFVDHGGQNRSDTHFRRIPRMLTKKLEKTV